MCGIVGIVSKKKLPLFSFKDSAALNIAGMIHPVLQHSLMEKSFVAVPKANWPILKKN
jgi:hypothetical protein